MVDKYMVISKLSHLPDELAVFEIWHFQKAIEL